MSKRYNTTEFKLNVTWDEPIFSDGHGQSDLLDISKPYPEPTAVLGFGYHLIQYSATKKNNGLRAECNFAIGVYREYQHIEILIFISPTNRT